MPSKIQARDLNTLCQLKRRQELSDGMGGAVPSFPVLADVWANIRPMRGGERFFGQQITPAASYVVTIRNRLDIAESDVIDAPNGRRYDVRFIRYEPFEPFLELECELEQPLGAA